MAVKPNVLGEVAPELVDAGTPVVSILAGTTLETLQSALPGVPVARVMPNLGAQVRQAVLCVAYPEGSDEGLREQVDGLLGLVGDVIELDEDLIDAATALMGCAPGYLAMIAEILVEAGEDEGLSEDQAKRMVARSMVATGGLLELRDPAELKRAVASPGGHDRGRARGPRGTRHAEGAPCRGRSLSREGTRMTVLLAITRDDIASYVNSLFIVYMIIIFIWVLISWIPRMPYNPTLRAVLDFVNQVTLPTWASSAGCSRRSEGASFSLDLSPIMAVIVLLIAAGIVVGADRGLSGRARRPARGARGSAGWWCSHDQATKAIVNSSIGRGDHVDFLPFLALTNTRNSGVAFGLAGDASPLLIGRRWSLRARAVRFLAVRAHGRGVWLAAGPARRRGARQPRRPRAPRSGHGLHRPARLADLQPRRRGDRRRGRGCSFSTARPEAESAD